MAHREPVTAEDLSPSLGLVRFLYVTAAVNGAAILVVEILGAKMLSPFMGTSHFVWTAQIGVTLIALATGYYLGGRWVDASPRLANLYYAVLAAAVYLCATVPLVKPVCFACLEMDLAIGSLLASAFLFLVPLALLAMTLPFLTRMLTRSIDEVGGNVGRLSAISTVGSVVGTALIGYVLIPNVHNSVTMVATGFTLIVLASVFLLVWKKDRSSNKIVAAIIFAGMFAYGGWTRTMKSAASIYNLEFANGSKMQLNQRQLARENSNYGELLVLERDFPIELMLGVGPNAVNYSGEFQTTIIRRRIYLNDLLTQNEYDPSAKKSLNLFTEMLHGLAHAYTPKIKEALCIGMGVGIVPMRLARENVMVDVVEINPDIVPLAEKWFDFDEGLLRQLYRQDGRLILHQLKQSQSKYDTIILDAFLGESSPSHLMTTEAFRSMADCLRDKGTLVINSFGRDLDEESVMDETKRVFNKNQDFLTASLFNTLKTVFEDVRIHGAGGGNVFFVAANHTLPEEPPVFDFSNSHVYLTGHYDTRSQPAAALHRTWTVDSTVGLVLTDDFNPVESRDAANREALRRDLAKRQQ